MPISKLVTSLATIFEAEPKNTSWSKSKYSGEISLSKSAYGELYLSVVKDGVEMWRHEIYFDFDYGMATPSFHFFEGDDQWFGISFTNEKEAADFYKVVVKESLQMTLQQEKLTKQSYATENASKAQGPIIQKTPRVTNNIIMPSKSLEHFVDEDDSSDSMSMRSSDSNLSLGTKKKEKKDKKSFLSFFKKDGKKKKDSLSIEDVGGPMDFKHLAHIGFNPVTRRFDINNIPLEWQNMFSKAGVTKKDLEDPHTANFIAGFVAEQQNTEAPSPLPKKKPLPQDTEKPASNEPIGAVPVAPLGPPLAPMPPPLAPPQQLADPEETNQNSLLPPPTDSRARLMASIRGAGLGVLKPAPKVEKPKGSESVSPATSNTGNDMASMLAAALAQRKRQAE